ncbi:glutaminyl-peptide cyclotransferase [Rhodococcus xishaensis]|uniref:Glutaminyl-peptide cyclotransferase n=1 Tax=Rhodococcus xishaensis TaxID=2487364 RepID=A0A438AQ31_9NOCA|nr:glutaminyl-peptide cyclotransferase [Rhodococcus xishaensis]RVW00770.1 glutaminyl-peptide cyclotransferase [Rhodococcus xishaensis]
MTPRRTSRLLAIAALLLAAVLLAGCSGGSSASAPADALVAEHLRTEIIRELPHDRTAFTQGLEISGDTLYESTGRVGQSWVRATDLESGVELARADLALPLFGEGITITGDTLWQITWKDGIAIARDRTTLAQQRQVRYAGEGWGLCAQADRLVMSNGSDTLTFRDPVSFDAIGSVDVTLNGRPIDRLNELDCNSDGFVYANVWTTDQIVKIDPATGAVAAQIDAANLKDALPSDQRDDIDVLNGIAQIPGTDRFLVTGKLWPRMFEVRFVS